MKEEDLWIGDQVQLIKSKRQGIYDGKLPNGKFRIKIGDKYILSSISNLIKIEEQKKTKQVVFDESISSQKLQYQDYNKSIDLHAEKLDRELLKQPPQMILRRQLATCRNHIDNAIIVGAKIIVIIHGRGAGELKKEVEYIISQYEEVHFSNPINNGGATEIWFK